MSRAKPDSFSPYFRTVDADQIRAAFLAAGAVEGYASISELIEAAVLKEVRRLQRRHNNGRTWEPVPAGIARTGRRTRSEGRASDDRSDSPQ
ncbi:ParB family protein [Arthrobacter sp. H14-L1]|uniref:ParB family protein n=1 Tax=Arthrobacter sp. H14-L1 TaxID=2996697 RepID=UPI00227093F1|nr:hypothetical protein [Arthrobacter sp. H14-L1]MCY0905768.1 hypothetical protein [Arthrobacter sp. H14-L1]